MPTASWIGLSATISCIVAQRLHDRSVELLARRALGGEGHDLARGEAALAQLLAHDRADGARGAHDCDAVLAHTRAPWGPKGCSASTWSAPSSKAVCSARTARSTSSAPITQEILIGEVEIISMLMPSSPSVEKTRAATPGWDFIPAPTTDTFPIAGSSATEWMPTSETSGSSAARAVRRSERGTVNDMSAD